MNTYKNYKDDALTADWLRDRGLNAKTFNTTKLDVVRAQTMAHTLMTQHLPLLSNKQLHALNDFQKAALNKRKRSRITPAFCHCVMNISANINRKLFKQHRKLDRQGVVLSKG
jgi:hypothetical protein